MATAASPTPLGWQAGHADIRYSIHRTVAKTTAASSHIPRPFISSATSKQTYTRSVDSSDDEDLAPIKLSAEAQAILGEDNSNVASDKENAVPRYSVDSDTADAHLAQKQHKLDPTRRSPVRNDGSPVPRVIHMKGSRPSPRATLARDGSFMYKKLEKPVAQTGEEAESKTPASRMRRIRVSGSRSQTRSPQSTMRDAPNGGSGSRTTHEYPTPDTEEHKNTPAEEPIPGPSTVTRPRRIDEQGVHSTMRVRRIGTGTLLNGPIRRGMIRRQSEEDEDQMGYKPQDVESPEIEQGRRAHEPDLEDLPDPGLELYNSLSKSRQQESQQFDTAPQRAKSPVVNAAPARQSPPSHPPPYSTSSSRSKPGSASNGSHLSTGSSNSNRKPIFKISSLPPLESAHDQENEPPPTFKRSKPTGAVLEVRHAQIEPEHKPIQQAPENVSPSRPPLVARSNNTPHRPAPAPPPKMSLIEAATANAGNARSKKSVHYVLNGRTYRRLDCIGRGGSSRVFRIMAENYKIFALKRVNLEEADMAAIAGYKGEIDLLQKLSNVDRVIRLFDYEVNEDKGVLNVMMELGESDFNKMLNEQLKGENAKIDITFTRHYWKEMLECVQAVHEHDIVHSDLKPANFLLVKGQLKLIDFGIANAIQDNTVNVHRENQIGTPNYMSPESLVCHKPAAGAASGQKIVKLGKPSDVWSLGCILYQMTYGQPPFAHISQHFERIMSIPNPKVEIKFPTTGIGGAVVPFGLIRTLRRCLQREQSLRPTIKELLSDQDPFLNPVAISPEMLGRVIGNVMGYCRKREESMKQAGVLGQDGQSCLPNDEEMRGWPAAFYDKLRQAQEEGSAW